MNNTSNLEFLTKEIVIGKDINDELDDALDDSDAKIDHRTNTE